jgi:NADH:ubiquinone oxidoreductase subunit 4 (subunit M)
MLLVYTSIFTFPFLYVIFYIYSYSGTISLFLLTNCFDKRVIFSIIIFFSFGVKLPIYGLHFWLPIAHVEAPTFGSIILAGILLKLGGVGLIRFSSLLDLLGLKSCLLGYLFLFLVYSTLVCCFQSDFKRLVAYSSVSHIITIPIILFSSSLIGVKGLISVMFLHGLSSPLLFILVGILYSFTFTRQHILMRGLLCVSPLLSLLLVLSFFFTLSAPPFPSFLAEVFVVISCVNL